MCNQQTSVSPKGTVVPGGFGRGFEAKAGQHVTIVDLEGQQAGDFVALSLADHEEILSPVHTRRHNRSIYLGLGDYLVSSEGRPMFQVVKDTVGIHDANVPACDPTRYAVDFGVPGHRNCLENLYEPLAKYGIDILQVPEPFNFFQNGPVSPDGRMGVTDPVSRAGDYLVLKALMDVACALSPCPQDIIPGNGLVVTDMLYAVTDEAPTDATLEMLQCH
ncbi:urea carboxylase-associated family protein [Palleronia sp. LCG004]|uniref:urea carboxylase-associated family protein n=1 Tax=Palleronia sp. LCG004 TaxID=3079304 RepID=UPI002942D143|nr:urea carboxylase-associated family protein [Palleronia sp. LCG004]WOI57897.1 urea carboxylase-associated family protein [Palleronia sp. LCG004]